MRIAFIADFRSVTARSWISGVAGLGHECLVISSHPVGSELEAGFRVECVPIGLSWLTRASGSPRASIGASRLRRSNPLVEYLRAHVGPSDLPIQAHKGRRILEEFAPDVVHALRIPFEGMYASYLRPTSPLVLSVWGTDFTLHAAGNRLLGGLTRRAVGMSHALIADCQRDVELAGAWGFGPGRPAGIFPGNGGLEIPSDSDVNRLRGQTRSRLDIADDTPVVLSPRGQRGWLRVDTLCRAVPEIVRRVPGTVTILVDSAGDGRITALVDELKIGDFCRLLPRQSPGQMTGLFAAADLAVSPSFHDGTPNTLLECMATGCFPVASKIAPVREWIDHGVNGLLFDPADPRELATLVVEALTGEKIREYAGKVNRDLVAERAERRTTLARVDEFYRKVGVL